MNRLTNEDRQKITEYICLNNECHSKQVQLDKTLAEWNSAKDVYLNRIFGDKLILSKPATIEKTIDVLEEEFACDEAMVHMCYEFRDALFNYERSSSIAETDRNDSNIWHYASQLTYNYILAKNEVLNTFEFIVPGTDKVIKIQQGMKPMKALAKFAELIGKQELCERMRIRHSQIHNQKTLKGELCLSIHPLDYMTMSDNASNWTSCMGWAHSGCYRAGTVEMMNSPTVIVAYLKSPEDMTHLPERKNDEFSWNNKKWRTLVVVDPENLITTVKDYPYASESLDEMVVNWLRELVAENGYPEYKETAGGYYEDDGRMILSRFYFRCGIMYDDFGRAPYYAVISDNAFYTSRRIEVEYSGRRTCVLCGCYVDDDCDGVELCCHRKDCRTDTRCEYCGGNHQEIKPMLVTDKYGNTKEMHLCNWCIGRLSRSLFSDAYFFVEEGLDIALTNGANPETVSSYKLNMYVNPCEVSKVEKFFGSKITSINHRRGWYSKTIDISNMPIENRPQFVEYIRKNSHYFCDEIRKDNPSFEDIIDNCVRLKLPRDDDFFIEYNDTAWSKFKYKIAELTAPMQVLDYDDFVDIDLPF